MTAELKNLPPSQIAKIKYSSNHGGLAYKEYGKYEDFKDYSDREITEMNYGIYKYSKHLLVDGDYFVDLNKVIATKCILQTVTYYKKPTLKDLSTNNHNRIENIRTFYIKDYYLISEDENGKQKEHKITRFLFKVGAIKQGRNKYLNLYKTTNDYKSMLFGKYPKDLFYPIKRYVNGLFFNDDYRIREFIYESNIDIYEENKRT